MFELDLSISIETLGKVGDDLYQVKKKIRFVCAILCLKATFLNNLKAEVKNCKILL